MEIKTKRVIQRSTGREVTINASDFDAMTYDEAPDPHILVRERATNSELEILESEYDALKHVKLVRAREKSSGDEITVDVDRFNPDLHEELSSDLELTGSEPEGPRKLHEMNTSEATDIVRGVGTLEELDRLADEEYANPKAPGGRKGVLSEISKRRETLSNTV